MPSALFTQELNGSVCRESHNLSEFFRIGNLSPFFSFFFSSRTNPNILIFFFLFCFFFKLCNQNYPGIIFFFPLNDITKNFVKESQTNCCQKSLFIEKSGFHKAVSGDVAVKYKRSGIVETRFKAFLIDR